jgi:hypothetical protein
MEIKFTDSFFESLERLARRQTWWYKIYDLFRYDIWSFFRNVYNFRKELWSFRSWDSMHNLQLLKRSLELTASNIKNSPEVEVTRDKKVEKILRAIEILENFCEDRFLEIAEKQLGKELILSAWNPIKMEEEDIWTFEEEPAEIREWNGKISNLAIEIEIREWKELWEILEGQDKNTFVSKENFNHEIYTKEYEEWFDGSGMRGWWS